MRMGLKTLYGKVFKVELHPTSKVRYGDVYVTVLPSIGLDPRVVGKSKKKLKFRNPVSRGEVKRSNVQRCQ